MPFEKCPVCGGEMVRKTVEKLLRGGDDTARISVDADVCLRCGERLYSADDVRTFERIRKQLERRETAGFIPVGQSYEVRRSA